MTLLIVAATKQLDQCVLSVFVKEISEKLFIQNCLGQHCQFSLGSLIGRLLQGHDQVTIKVFHNRSEQSGASGASRFLEYGRQSIFAACQRLSADHR